MRFCSIECLHKRAAPKQLEIYARAIYGAALEHNCKAEKKTTERQQVQNLAINRGSRGRGGQSVRLAKIQIRT